MRSVQCLSSTGVRVEIEVQCRTLELEYVLRRGLDPRIDYRTGRAPKWIPQELAPHVVPVLHCRPFLNTAS